MNGIKINLGAVIGKNFVYADLKVPHYIVAKNGKEIKLFKSATVLSASMTRRIVEFLLEVTVEEQIEQFRMVADCMPKPKKVAGGMTEYRVQTQCGRNFAWSANGLEDLFRSLTDRGYRATKVELMSEYEAECERQYEQARLEHELHEAVEKGDAA